MYVGSIEAVELGITQGDGRERRVLREQNCGSSFHAFSYLLTCSREAGAEPAEVVYGFCFVFV